VRLIVRLVRAVDRILAALETAGVTVGLLLMVALAFAQVVLRNTGRGGVPWFPTVTQHLVLWVGMLGASLAVAERKHISVEVVSKLVTPEGRRVVEGIVDAATIVMCALLAWISWGYIAFQEMGPDALFELGGVRVLRWWSLTAMPIGFALMSFRFFRLALERIFVDEPVDPERDLRREVEAYERKHPSGERALGEGEGRP
jgi:TRAP-type C4-dicarboxylate transport system permease small subunit